VNVTRIHTAAPGPEAPAPEPEAPAHRPEAGHPSYDPCDRCGSPLDRRQRYCVVCGTRRKHASDPAARFLSAATSRSRAASSAPAASAHRPRRSPGIGTAAILALIPVAVGIGVLVGRAGNSGDDKLLAALRQQQAQVAAAPGVAPAAASTAPVAATSTASGSLTSDFSLQSGYTVELQTLPSNSTNQVASAAEAALKARGASAVGLISQADFKITPTPPAGVYVIYSGRYKTRAAADQALAMLRRRFPAAKVIAVQSTADGGKVLATTPYGSATQVAGFKPTTGQKSTGSQIVQRISHQSGSNYTGSQQGLPDKIVVP
jgi:hypothetical protein